MEEEKQEILERVLRVYKSRSGEIEISPDLAKRLKTMVMEHEEELKETGVSVSFLDEITSKEKQNQPTRKRAKTKGAKSEEQNKQGEEKTPEITKTENERTREIAKKKGISPNNVLVVRSNSNLYKDHPELEPNLIFSKGDDGVIRAEYIDENGELQPSRFFEPSQTSLRQKTVSLGDNGKPVEKEVPYQVMKTKNLNKVDKDIKDIRINIDMDTYGYLEISEARQGRSGEWLSHEIEMQGRDYNSRDINEQTSIRTRRADPDTQTKLYQQTERTGLVEDGIMVDEMYLMQYASEIIEHFIKEGYQRSEAVKIFNYMIGNVEGEEQLTEKEAKEKVNEQIKDKERQQKPEIER